MGRMADARKRVRGRGPTPPVPAPEAAAPEPVEAQPVPRLDPPPAQVPAAAGKRLSLPASGLAEDILAMAEAAPLGPAAEPAAALEPVTQAEPVSRSQSISFFSAPAREEKKAVEATEHLVSFFLAGEEYGIDVRLVQEIIRITDITQIPRAPEFIKGVINLRGRIIPVVDLKRKLSLGAVEHTRQARIVVVKVRDRLTGLLVDGASQVLKIPLSIIEPPPEEVVEIDANLIRGVAKLEKRLIILMDLPRVLASEKEAVALVSPA